jgi:hypothetical protein
MLAVLQNEGAPGGPGAAQKNAENADDDPPRVHVASPDQGNPHGGVHSGIFLKASFCTMLRLRPAVNVKNCWIWPSGIHAAAQRVTLLLVEALESDCSGGIACDCSAG